jgi:hypothetical protein
VYYDFSISPPGPLTIKPGAFLYPMDNYFNLNSTGDDPFTGVAPSSGGGPPLPSQLVISNCFLAYVAPFKGDVVRVSVNSAFSRTYFNGALFDFIIMDSTSTLTAGLTNWTVPYATTKQMTGWSDTFSGPTTFFPGDLIFCYIVDDNSNGWNSGLTPPIPLPADNGIFNVTLYLRFSI